MKKYDCGTFVKVDNENIGVIVGYHDFNVFEEPLFVSRHRSYLVRMRTKVPNMVSTDTKIPYLTIDNKHFESSQKAFIEIPEGEIDRIKPYDWRKKVLSLMGSFRKGDRILCSSDKDLEKLVDMKSLQFSNEFLITDIRESKWGPHDNFYGVFDFPHILRMEVKNIATGETMLTDENFFIDGLIKAEESSEEERKSGILGITDWYFNRGKILEELKDFSLEAPKKSKIIRLDLDL